MALGIPKGKWLFINLTGVAIAIGGILLIKKGLIWGWALFAVGAVMGLFYFKKN